MKRLMLKILKVILKAWKDPVWSKVISAGLLALFISPFAIWLGLFPYIRSALLTVNSWIKVKLEIPVWQIILILPLLIFSIPIFKLLRHKSEPRYLKYKRDNIIGIEWSWKYSHTTYNDTDDIYGLTPRCPDCKSILDINKNFAPLVHCINDECNWRWQNTIRFTNKGHHSSQLYDKVLTEIDRKIHTGRFRT